MFKKELADVLKQTGWFLLALVAATFALPPLRLIPSQPFPTTFAFLLIIGQLFWALFLGASIFGRERRQRAMEYALTLPYSRLGLLLRLAGARLIVWLGLFAVAYAAQAWWLGRAVFGEALGTGGAFFLLGLTLFGISISMAPLIENFIILCLISAGVWLAAPFLEGGLFGLARLLKGIPLSSRPGYLRPFYGIFGPSLGIPSWFFLLFYGMLIIAFTAALLLAFKRYDLRLSTTYVRKYLFSLGLALLLAFGISVSLGALGSSPAFLTEILAPNHKLVQFDPYAIHVQSQTGTRSFRGFILTDWPRVSSDGRIVFKDVSGIYLYDPSNDQNRLLINARGIEIRSYWLGGEGLLVAGNRPGGNPLSLFYLDLTAGLEKPLKIPVPEETLAGLISGVLFGTGKSGGRRFWLFRSRRANAVPVRLWEDGSVQDIGDGIPKRIRWAAYINGLVLLDGSEGLSIFKETGERLELAKRIREGASFFSPWNEGVPEQPKAPALYGKRGDRVFKLDLTSLEITDIGALKTARGSWIEAFLPDLFILIENDPALKKLAISRILDDRVEKVREFEDYDSSQKGTRLEIQRSGILLTRRGSTKAFAFPDLREIKFRRN